MRNQPISRSILACLWFVALMPSRDSHQSLRFTAGWSVLALDADAKFASP
ncbi:hypothetical protein ACA618_11755 [Lactiplantibacillus pentosus]|nr:hypothetical protein [Lactiplantibacillus pentosus]